MISSDYSSDHSCKGEDEKSSDTSSETHEQTMIDEKLEVRQSGSITDYRTLEIVSPTPSQHAVISPPSPRAVAEKMPPKKKVRYLHRDIDHFRNFRSQLVFPSSALPRRREMYV